MELHNHNLDVATIETTVGSYQLMPKATITVEGDLKGDLPKGVVEIKTEKAAVAKK
jgi:hypothetical protein